jgi:PEP-CTERM motif
MSTKSPHIIPLLFVCLILLALAPLGRARADSIYLDFSGITSNNASNAAVQAYMQSMLPTGARVTVTGAVGQAGANSYTGDGHVVGPGGKAATLGTWDLNANKWLTKPGSFIMNNQGNNSGDPSSDRIVMTFTGLKVYGVSFDFEIFPDASGTVANPPDFTFLTNLQSTPVFTQLGVVPGTAGKYSATWTSSPASGFGSETSPQFLGSYSNSDLGGATTLTFEDWPAHIGITRLRLVTTPEPSSVVLFGAGAIGLWFTSRRRKQLAI